MYVKNNKVVRLTYLSPDEESFLVAAVEIEGPNRLTIDTASIASELHSVVESVKARPTFKEIAPQSSENHCRTVVKRVNVTKEAHDKQSNNIRTGLIKVSSLSNNRSKQSDPRLDWIMFQNIAHMYRDIIKQERF